MIEARGRPGSEAMTFSEIALAVFLLFVVLVFLAIGICITAALFG